MGTASLSRRSGFTASGTRASVPSPWRCSSGSRFRSHAVCGQSRTANQLVRIGNLPSTRGLLPLRVEALALVAQALAPSAAHLVVRLDVVAHSAGAVVVVHVGRQLGVERGYGWHCSGSSLANRWLL